MIRIEEVPELEAPEFVFTAEERRRAAAEYAARLKAAHEESKKAERRAEMINIGCFFGGMLMMAAFIFTGIYM